MMLSTASLFLYFIWTLGPGPDEFTIINQTFFTTFVIGLASFLVWIVTVILDIKEKIEKR